MYELNCHSRWPVVTRSNVQIQDLKQFLIPTSIMNKWGCTRKHDLFKCSPLVASVFSVFYQCSDSSLVRSLFKSLRFDHSIDHWCAWNHPIPIYSPRLLSMLPLNHHYIISWLLVTEVAQRCTVTHLIGYWSTSIWLHWGNRKTTPRIDSFNVLHQFLAVEAEARLSLVFS